MKVSIPSFQSQLETWVELPPSKYGIRYALEGRAAIVTSKRAAQGGRTNCVKKRPSKMSPFENALLHLDDVTRRMGYADNTALMYIREIFEPGDTEFDYITDYVCASQLSQEQVDRMRIMILPQRREENLVSYVDKFRESASADIQKNPNNTVLEHFDEFHCRYLAITDPKAKFDALFGFSYALKHRSEWIFQFENQRKREKMVESLAKHWRNLMVRSTAEELGVDEEFSYQALLTFLDSFKLLCDSIETFGNPPIKFIYKAGNKKMVTFDDDCSSLTTGDTRTVSSRLSN